MEESIALLKQNLSGLSAKDRSFADSLLKQYEKKVVLSEKQLYWVEALSSRPLGIPDFTRSPVDVGEFTGVIELFEKANATLNYPKLALKLPGGQEIRLKLMGSNSKYQGSVAVNDAGPFGANKWYGRVSKDGKWFPGFEAESIKNDLTMILSKLAKSPARVAADYGKLTGHCAFCMSPLTDPKSTAVGYGPICAQQWNLPWGDAKVTKVS
jgi:hypothetical protein